MWFRYLHIVWDDTIQWTIQYNVPRTRFLPSALGAELSLLKLIVMPSAEFKRKVIKNRPSSLEAFHEEVAGQDESVLR